MQQHLLFANDDVLHRFGFLASLLSHQVEPRWSSQSTEGDEEQKAQPAQTFQPHWMSARSLSHHALHGFSGGDGGGGGGDGDDGGGLPPTSTEEAGGSSAANSSLDATWQPAASPAKATRSARPETTAEAVSVEDTSMSARPALLASLSQQSSMRTLPLPVTGVSAPYDLR